MDVTEVPKSYSFNPDPDWQRIAESFWPIVDKIALKACMYDSFLRDDCKQEAYIALATVRPERIKGYDPQKHGAILPGQIPTPVKAYLGNVARNTIYSFLTNRQKGDWSQGRTVTKTDKETGEIYKEHQPARYVSLTWMQDEAGIDIS
jgi:hypothetical protein